MRLCTFAPAGGAPRPGIVLDDGIVDLSLAGPELGPDLRAIVAAFDRLRPALERFAASPPAGALVARSAVTLLAPILDPSKIICIGLNYRDHAAEVKMDLPSDVIVFAKWSNGLTGDGAPIVIPRESDKVDYEAELGVVIGRRTRRIAETDALGAVFGYTCINDVSVRDYQMRTSQWTLGKAFDTHAPCGPWIVTADEIPDPQVLGIRCRVGDETLQDSSTAEMVFGVARLIAELSAVMTLEPGDLIATGTPAGVGTSRSPRRWLRPGERVRVEIDRIGALENPVRGPA